MGRWGWVSLCLLALQGALTVGTDPVVVFGTAVAGQVAAIDAAVDSFTSCRINVGGAFGIVTGL